MLFLDGFKLLEMLVVVLEVWKLNLDHEKCKNGGLVPRNLPRNHSVRFRVYSAAAQFCLQNGHAAARPYLIWFCNFS